MTSARQSKLEKKRRREKKLRRERHLRRNRPSIAYEDDFDVESALEDLPVEMHVERIQRRIARATGKRIFDDGADVMRELERINSPGNERLAAELHAEHRQETAQDYVFLAFDPENADHVLELVHAAIEIDPDCVDALALSAIYDDISSDERIVRLERAVATGERLLGGTSFLEENRGRFWTDVLTRPYLRARRTLANARIVREELDVAAAHFEALLQLDPADRLDIRDALLGFALARADLVRARALLEELKANDSRVEPWGRVLERWLSGDRRGAARELIAARSKNGWVELALLEPEEFDARAETFDVRRGAFDDEPTNPEILVRAAERVSVRLGRAWAAHPEASGWLAEGGPASTEDERRVAVNSFAPPVAKLFALGEVDHGDAWFDYRASSDLSGADVPELIRLATDPDLHELTEREAWAPLHAWRALAELGAASAVEPLLRLAIEQPEDDWLLGDLPRVLAALGPAALPKIVAWMKQPADDDFPRVVAYEAIPALVAKHPSLRERALEAFTEELDLAHERDTMRNGLLVSGLIDLRAVELAPRIERLFEEDLVDPTVAGDWDQARAELEEPRST